MSLVECAVLQEVDVMVDAKFKDALANQEVIANSESAVALIENTTADFSDLTGVKDRELKLNWLSYCDAGTEEISTDCETTATAQIAANCESHTITLSRQSKGFFVAEKDLRNKKYETKQLIAKGIEGDLVVLDEWWSEQSVARINSFVGVNAYDNPAWNVTGTDTFIPAAMWTPSITGELALTAKLNKFTSPFLLSGKNMYMANWNAQMNATDPTGTSAKKRADYFKIYHDLFNLDAYNSGTLKTYMIQKGALAFATKSYYRDYTAAAPFKGPNDTYIWSVASPTLPGVFYDVHYQYTCVSNEYIHSFQIKTYGDVFENPLGCDPTNTGVLSLTCGTGA